MVTFIFTQRSVLIPFLDRIRTVGSYAANSEEWRTGVTTYYEISERQTKTIFMRLVFDGSIRPDAEWNATRPKDILPCLLQLRHELLNVRGLGPKLKTRNLKTSETEKKEKL